jgi:hypothetical protein
MPLEDIFASLRGRGNVERREGRAERAPGAGSVQAGPIGRESHASADETWHPPLREPSAEASWHPPLLIPSRYSEAERGSAESELGLLREVYGNVLDSSGKRAYAHFTERRWQYRVEEYLDHRAAFFGSTAQYLAYLELARAELEAEDGKLRRKIDPAESTRPVLPHWREAQVYFYAWTRRAFEKQLGAGVNVPALINAGKSKALEAALRQVRADYGQGFNPQGFNPRPIKATRGYRLGTLSDHALGTAIDIRPSTNAQIEASDWQHILSYTGRSLDLPTRRELWVIAPRELHDALVKINEVFVKQVRDAVAVELAKDQPEAAALAAVVKADVQLSKLSGRFVGRWRNGFYDLPWELIKELHEEKFIWGATFGRLDLHHFELP